jgi:hypothetical protein
VCSLFRNEGAARASDLIIEAVAATKAYFGEPPKLGIITFVAPTKIRSVNPGFCYKKAGWKLVGATKGGKPCLQQLPEELPDAQEPTGFRGPHGLEDIW